MKVLLICGGQSSEHIISRMSASNIRKHIKDSYEVKMAGITKEGIWYQINDQIKDYAEDCWLDESQLITNVFEYLKSFDIVFPCLHGLYGEDGTIQGLLEMADRPYTGCRVADSALAMDKVLAKKVFTLANIPTTPSLFAYKRYDGKVVIIRDDQTQTEDIVSEVKETLGLPVFIKASRSGSSVGCYKVTKEEDILPRLKEASYYDSKILIEKAIQATELEVGVLGNDDLLVSRVGQIMPHGEFYTFESKYEDKQSSTCIPAGITDEQAEYIRENAKKAFHAIDGHGLARCDFFLDNVTGDIYLNEINTMPGFTDISMYPMLLKDAGVDTSDLIDRLLDLAKQR